MIKRPLSLVLGGARSGKSAFAEAKALDLAGNSSTAPLYVATCQAFDSEMEQRIAGHRDRRGASWQIVEESVEVARAIVTAGTDQVVLVDCLTLWLTNLMMAGHATDNAFDELASALRNRNGPMILVSNEVGLGIVPENAMARRFRDLAGQLHQSMAQMADEVIFVTAGLPLILKDDNNA